MTVLCMIRGLEPHEELCGVGGVWVFDQPVDYQYLPTTWNPGGPRLEGLRAYWLVYVFNAADI